MTVGIVFFFTPEVDAHSAAMQRPPGDGTMFPTDTATGTSVSIVTDTPTSLPSPTITPILTPTATPLPTPTNTPSPTPTNTPVPTNTALPRPTGTPTTQPNPPRATPTTVLNPTSTSVGGALPPGSTPSGNTTQQTTPTPSPTGAKLNGSGLPPTATDVVPSPTSNPYTTAAITTQDASTPILSKQTGLIIGALLLLGAAVLSVVLWRQRQVNLARQANLQQQARGYQTWQIPQFAHEDVTAIFGYQTEPPSEGLMMLPAYSVPPAMMRDMQRDSGMAAPSNDSLMQTMRMGDSTEMVSEAGQWYQGEQENQEMVQLPVTPLPPQEMTHTIDSSLETVMRQAQMGLFALPDKEELS